MLTAVEYIYALGHKRSCVCVYCNVTCSVAFKGKSIGEALRSIILQYNVYTYELTLFREVDCKAKKFNFNCKSLTYIYTYMSFAVPLVPLVYIT